MNTNKSRSVGAVVLYPSGNEVGGWILMSLVTGKEIYRTRWDELPADEEVLNRIYEIVIEEGQKSIDKNFVYETNNGEVLNDTSNVDITKDKKDVELSTNEERENIGPTLF